MTPAFLRANLCFLHGTMMASETLLYRAIYKCAMLGDLAKYYMHHLEEERGHLRLLEKELWQLGVTRVIKFPAAAQLAGAQYYYIEHEHPSMLLGYMAALEGLAPSIEQLEELEEQHGPLVCTRHHALHDPHHSAQLAQQIDALPAALRSRARENEQFVLADLCTRIAPMIEQASKHF